MPPALPPRAPRPPPRPELPVEPLAPERPLPPALVRLAPPLFAVDPPDEDLAREPPDPDRLDPPLFAALPRDDPEPAPEEALPPPELAP